MDVVPLGGGLSIAFLVDRRQLYAPTLRCVVPFTPSHAAAVLPLMRPLLRLGVPPSTLVIGSVSPDLLFYIPIRTEDLGTHTLLGATTIDLALGSAVYLIWQLASPRFRAVFLPGLPTAPGPPLRRLRHLPLPAAVLFGLFLGILTHLGWDSFTHANGWAVARLPWLPAQYGPLPGYEWMQYLSGVAGLAAIVAWAVARLRRGADTEVSQRNRRRRIAAWGGFAAAAIAGAALGVWWGLDGETDRLRGALFLAATRSLFAGAIGIAATLIATAITDRVRPRRFPDSQADGAG